MFELIILVAAIVYISISVVVIATLLGSNKDKSEQLESMFIQYNKNREKLTNVIAGIDAGSQGAEYISLVKNNSYLTSEVQEAEKRMEGYRNRVNYLEDKFDVKRKYSPRGVNKTK